MRSFLISRWLSRGLITLLLFAQTAFAAQPCMQPAMDAFAGRMVCIQSGDANLCLNTEDNLLSGNADPVVLAAPTSAVLTLPALPDEISIVAVNHTRLKRATDPPITIRNCCFRN